MSITIEEVAGRISAWHGKQIAIHPLAGGLTNSNYRVQVDHTSYVVRIPGQSTIRALRQRPEWVQASCIILRTVL
jgi:Ser/Thr protein kinase RdoA (MazF antagonist)